MKRIRMIKFLIASFIMVFSIGLLSVNQVRGADIVYEYDFESGWDGWGVDYGVWEVGTPTAGPESCHQGSKCAGTVLAGNYPGDTDSHLISPSIILPGVSSDQELHLRFWHWFSYHHYDAGYVQISVYDEVAEEWSDWATIGNSLVNNTPAWSLMGVELTEYANQKVRIAFYHTAASSWESTGWYIDDIQIIKKLPEVTGSFESGWGDWSADRGVWEVGTPTAGPDSCHGGGKCAGTVLGGNYPGDTDSRLISPSIMLCGVSDGEEIHLRFWHWFSYHHYDAGYVQISVYDELAEEWSDWTTIGNPVINSSSVWSPSPLFELTEYANKKIRIAFYHTAASSWESTGWYVDDFQIIGCPDAAKDLLYTPVTPCRIVDTRKAGGAISASGIRSYNVRGAVASQGGNPAGCTSLKGEPRAVHVNVTSVPLGNGWITAYPYGSAAPTASIVNYRSDAQNVANSGTIKTCFNCAKDINIKSGGGKTHVIIDVLGYYYSNP